MPRSKPRDPAVFLLEFAAALRAWDAVGRAPGPELDAVVALLWEDFGAAILAYFRFRLPVEEKDADEDLAQELLLRLLDDLPDFALRSYPELCGWTWARAFSTFTRWRRHRHSQGRDPNRIDRAANLTLLMAGSTSPDADLLLDELWQELLARLTPKEHEVITLLSEGLTSEQIAERLGCSANAVYIHVSRIRAKIAQLIAERGERNEP